MTVWTPTAPSCHVQRSLAFARSATCSLVRWVSLPMNVIWLIRRLCPLAPSSATTMLLVTSRSNFQAILSPSHPMNPTHVSPLSMHPWVLAPLPRPLFYHPATTHRWTVPSPASPHQRRGKHLSTIAFSTSPRTTATSTTHAAMDQAEHVATSLPHLSTAWICGTPPWPRVMGLPIASHISV
jgi:hypothetical protein